MSLEFFLSDDIIIELSGSQVLWTEKMKTHSLASHTIHNARAFKKKQRQSAKV